MRTRQIFAFTSSVRPSNFQCPQFETCQMSVPPQVTPPERDQWIISNGHSVPFSGSTWYARSQEMFIAVAKP